MQRIFAFWLLASGFWLLAVTLASSSCSPLTQFDSLKPSIETQSSVDAQTNATRSVDVVLFIGQSNDNGLSPVTGLPIQYTGAYSNVLSWDQTSNAAVPYQLGVSDHAITQAIVPSYDNGFGPDVAYVYQWNLSNPRPAAPLFIFKKDLTPPVSTNGASIAAWLDGVNGSAPLYTAFLAEWNAFNGWLTAHNYKLGKVTCFTGIGEQDANDGNPDFAASLTRFFNRFIADGVLTSSSSIYLAKKQRPQDVIIAAAQQTYANTRPGKVKVITLPNPTFLAVDGTHYTQEAMLRLGMVEYAASNK